MVRAHAGEPVPASLDGYAALVVLGGDQHVYPGPDGRARRAVVRRPGGAAAHGGTRARAHARDLPRRPAARHRARRHRGAGRGRAGDRCRSWSPSATSADRDPLFAQRADAARRHPVAPRRGHRAARRRGAAGRVDELPAPGVPARRPRLGAAVPHRVRHRDDRRLGGEDEAGAAASSGARATTWWPASTRSWTTWPRCGSRSPPGSPRWPGASSPRRDRAAPDASCPCSATDGGDEPADERHGSPGPVRLHRRRPPPRAARRSARGLDRAGRCGTTPSSSPVDERRGRRCCGRWPPRPTPIWPCASCTGWPSRRAGPATPVPPGPGRGRARPTPTCGRGSRRCWAPRPRSGTTWWPTPAGGPLLSGATDARRGPVRRRHRPTRRGAARGPSRRPAAHRRRRPGRGDRPGADAWTGSRAWPTRPWPPRCGWPRPSAARRRPLAVIAMGKCGGRELNYVSDVDVIFVCADERRPGRLPGDRGPADADLRRGRLAGGRQPAAGGQPGPAGPHARLAPGLLHAVGPHLGVPGAAQGPAGGRGRRRSGRGGWRRCSRSCGTPPSAPRPSRTSGPCAGASSTTSRPRNATGRSSVGPGGLRDIEFAVQLLQLVHGRGDEALRVAVHTGRSAGAGPSGATSGGPTGRRWSRRTASCARVEHRLQLQRLRRTHTVPGAPARRGAALAGPRDGLPGRGQARRGRVVPGGLGRPTPQEVRRLHAKLVYRPLVEAVARVPERRAAAHAGGGPGTPGDPRLPRPGRRAAPPGGADRRRVPLRRDPAHAAARAARRVRGGPRAGPGPAGLPQGLGHAQPDPVVPAPAARRGPGGAAARPAAGPVPVRRRAARPRPGGAAAHRRRRRAGAADPVVACGRFHRGGGPARRGRAATAGAAAPAPRSRRSGRCAGGSCSASRAPTCSAACGGVAPAGGPLDVVRRRARRWPTWPTPRWRRPCARPTRGSGARGMPFAIIGMGRLGGAEMSYSSDADVLFVYEPPPGHGRGRGQRRGPSGRRGAAPPAVGPVARAAVGRRRRPATGGPAGPARAQPGRVRALLRPVVEDLGGAGAAAGPVRRAATPALGERFLALADRVRYPARRAHARAGHGDPADQGPGGHRAAAARRRPGHPRQARPGRPGRRGVGGAAAAAAPRRRDCRAAHAQHARRAHRRPRRRPCVHDGRSGPGPGLGDGLAGPQRAHAGPGPPERPGAPPGRRAGRRGPRAGPARRLRAGRVPRRLPAHRPPRAGRGRAGLPRREPSGTGAGRALRRTTAGSAARRAGRRRHRA